MRRRRAWLMVAGLLAAVGSVALARGAAAETPSQRGAYLMHGVVACGNCHTPKDAAGNRIEAQELSGGVVFNDPAFRAVAPNITPDKETGIGNWTDAQIIDAIRNGKRPDGRIIGPPMPIEFYAHISDSDVKAIVTYLRSVKPIRHAVEKSKFNIPLPPAYGPPVLHVADVPHTEKLAYGQYLSNIGHCMECHTPRPRGMLDLKKIGAGGREIEAFPSGMVVSANLTPANPNGIAHWTNKQIETAITTGVRPDGRRLAKLMAFDWYSTIAPADLDAIVVYLRTLQPATP